MFKAAVKSLLGHKLRLVTTALAIVLGVGFMAASFILTDSVQKAFDSLFVEVGQNVDAVVQARTAFPIGGGDPGGLSQPIPADLAGTVARVDGVAAAQGEVFGVALVIGKDGQPVGDPDTGGSAATNWPTVEAFNNFDLVAGGPPTGPTDVVLSKGTADDGDFEVGDPVRLLTPTGQNPVVDGRVVGIARFGGSDSFGGFGFLAMESEAAQANFVAPGLVTTVSVKADGGVSQQQLVDRIAPLLSPTTGVLTGRDFTQRQQDDIQGGLAVVNRIFVGFALLSLLVSVFLIYNTFSIIIAQRTKELALLRALGASRRQVLSSVLVEAVAVAAAASAVGIVAGIGMAGGLKAAIAALGAPFPEGPTVIAPRTVVVSVLVGVVVTVASALLPAWRAARVAPVAAMREVTLDQAGRSRWRLVVGAVLLAAGVALLLFGAVDTAVALAGLGGAVVLTGLVVLGPVLASPVGRLIGSATAAFGITGRLARDNAVRNPKRTAATATALMISLTLVGAVTILVSSFVGTINRTFEARFLGDFSVDSGTFSNSGMSPVVADRVAGLPEVAAVSGVRSGPAAPFGEVRSVYFVNPTTIERIVDTGIVAGSLEALGDSGIAVSTDVAEDRNLQVGDRVPVTFATGEMPLMEVVAIYEDASSITQNDDPYLLGIPAAERYLPPDRGDLRVLVLDRQGVPLEQARAAIAGAVETDFPQVDVRDKGQVKDEAARAFNQFLSFFLVLLGLSVLIGLLGVVNTMLLSIFERTRELGLLRAVGMRRRQLGASISMESVIIALLGTTLGIATGIAVGAAVITSVRSDLENATVVVPFAILALIFAATVVLGVLAAAWPARRATKLDVLDAIGTE